LQDRRAPIGDSGAYQAVYCSLYDSGMGGMFVTMFVRECPDLPCTALLEDDEWKPVYMIAKNEAPPETPLSLGGFTVMVPSLEGYLNRKCDGPPVNF